MSKDRVFAQKRLFDPNYRRSPLRNSTEKLNVSGYYSPNYYRPSSNMQTTFLKGKQANSYQHAEPLQRNYDQPEKKRFQLSDMFQLRPQSPTIFTKKRSYAEQNLSQAIGNSRNQSPYQYGLFQSPIEQPKRVLIKNASEYLPSKRPISGEIQWQKPELNLQRNTKFEIERLRMELEQYKLSKRNSNSSLSKINVYRDTRENNRNSDNYKPINNYKPYLRNQEIEKPKLSPEKAKKQPFQLSSQLKESERRKTPEGNRVDQLRKQLYSTYKSDRELFFESLNKSTPYNKIANQRELQQSFRDQIKYNLDKKFI